MINLELPIIFEDDFLVVVNKPYGVVVNRADSVVGETVQDWAEERLGIEAKGEGRVVDFTAPEYTEYAFRQRSGIAHRLDKDTSGVLVLCKTPEALAVVMRQFKERKTEKEYAALVHGRLEPQEGSIRLPMARSRFDRQKFVVDPLGKPAETLYRVVAYYKGPESGNNYMQGFTMMSLVPKTGRTHQLRVHLTHINHPIVGDVKYVGHNRAKLDQAWCPRQFLHAKQLTITHPHTNMRITFEAPLADDLQAVLATLEKV
jgi:23S rRNA pseudouridine1911/1915/1917 synthase